MFERRLSDADLEACLAFDPYHVGAELVGREKALAAWRSLLSNHAFNSGVFFGDSAAGAEILGFGAAAFVLRAFVDAELANPRPGVNARFVAAVADGDSPVLGMEQLRRGNAGGGLDILCLLGVYRHDVSRERALEILSVMSASFVAAHSGYRICRVINEAIGDVEIADLQATGGIWRHVRSFDASNWGCKSALFMMSRDDSIAVPTSITLPLFRYSDPILRLREPDQELLKAALSNLTDEELARQLNVHIGTVKKRWLEIHQRIAEVRPELLLDQRHVECERARGKQKRHHVLAYVRQHLEELRPHSGA